MVITRAQGKAVFDHILDIVLDINGSIELKSALVKEGYVDVISLMTIDDDTIDSLTFVDSNDATKVVPLKNADKSILKIGKHFTFIKVRLEILLWIFMIG